MTDPTPDPPAGLPLPALVARVRGEGERWPELRRRALELGLITDPLTFFVRAPSLIDNLFAAALPADALALCGRAERLEKENRRLRDTLIEMTRTERLSAGMTWQVYGRQAHDLAVAALAGEPAEGDAGGGRS
jgi:hypothetical protein